MRKLLLFGLLAGVFGLAFGLERLFTRPETPEPAAANKARFVIGGGAPRSVPEESLEVIDDEPAGGKPRPKDGAAKAKTRGEAGMPGEAAGTPEAQKPAPAATVRFHEVTSRETLWTIAKKELGAGTRCRELAEWNGLDADAPLKVGTRLRLAPLAADATPVGATARTPTDDRPADGGERTHKLLKGETLSKVAARYLGDAGRWREIQSLNRIADPANVPEGSVLKLPLR
jgi:nucleoid-associated protein YgaU